MNSLAWIFAEALILICVWLFRKQLAEAGNNSANEDSHL